MNDINIVLFELREVATDSKIYWFKKNTISAEDLENLTTLCLEDRETEDWFEACSWFNDNVTRFRQFQSNVDDVGCFTCFGETKVMMFTAYHPLRTRAAAQ